MQDLNKILKRLDVLIKKHIDAINYDDGVYQYTPEVMKIESELSDLKDTIHFESNLLSKPQRFNFFLKIKKVIDSNNIINLSDSVINRVYWGEYQRFKKNPQDYKPKVSFPGLTLDDIVRELESFDWSYEMADDNRIWKNGESHRKEIGEMIDEFIDLNPKLKTKLLQTLKKVFAKGGRRSFFEPVNFSKQLRGI